MKSCNFISAFQKFVRQRRIGLKAGSKIAEKTSHKNLLESRSRRRIKMIVYLWVVSLCVSAVSGNGMLIRFNFSYLCQYVHLILFRILQYGYQLTIIFEINTQQIG